MKMIDKGAAEEGCECVCANCGFRCYRKPKEPCILVRCPKCEGSMVKRESMPDSDEKLIEV